MNLTQRVKLAALGTFATFVLGANLSCKTEDYNENSSSGTDYNNKPPIVQTSQPAPPISTTQTASYPTSDSREISPVLGCVNLINGQIVN